MKRGHGRKNGRSLIGSVLILCMIFSSLSVYAAAASEPETEDKVVKVGWYQSDLFQTGESDEEEKSGYSYEYLQKVADYTGWTYEYVYGGWTDLFEKFKAGEIDVMAGVSDTPEREEYLSFPGYEMGMENYCLYQHESNKTMDITDPASFCGQKIGAIRNNRMSEYLEQWIADNGYDLQVVYYDIFEDRDADFASGVLDGVVATDNNVLPDSDYSLVSGVGQEPYYLAVTKSRPDLLKELNEALSLMQQMDPYFLQNLRYSSYGKTLSSATLTDKEKEWLEGHDTLILGYMDDYLPYCSSGADGQVTGLITDVMTAMLRELGIDDRLTVSYRAYSDYSDMVGALRSGEIDAAFPVGGGTWNEESDGVDATTPVASAGMDLVYKGEFRGTAGGRFAVNRNNNLQIYFTQRNFPDAEQIEYGSIQECFEAVQNGEADFTVLNGLRADLVRDNSKYRDLSVMQLSQTDDRCLGVRNGSSALLLLLNRGLGLIGSDYGTSASYNYVSAENTMTLREFLRVHMKAVLLIILALAAVIVGIFVMHAYRMREADRKLRAQLAQNRELTRELEKKNRELEKSRDEAEAANSAKTTFLFNMSHDIRTPMNAILGFRDLLEKHQDDPEKRADYLRKIEDAGHILLSIINNVLEMARIEKGTLKIEETVCSADQFSDGLYSIYHEMMAQKGLTFTREVRVQHPYVYCDSTKLREIYMNILGNAYKYTNEGSVTMLLEEVPCDREGRAMYRTTITDTGIGMSEEFLPHVFEEFSREHNTTDAKVEGTGLGMPIVKRLVELMGGTIEVKSKKCEGSSFIVTIPHRIAEKPETACACKAAEKTVSFEGKRILLAEDNDLNAEIAQEILGETGFEVERAEDGAVCLNMLKAAEPGRYDLILMDIQMPNMNGYQAARAIRALEDPGRANIPIVAMTANAFEEDRKNALDAGMNGHLAKPIDVKALMETLRNILNRT